MIAAVAVAGHAVLDAWLGWVLLCFPRGRPLVAAHLPAALLLGMYAETLFVGTLIFLGVPLAPAVLVMLGGVALLTAIAWQRGALRRPALQISRPRWFEVLVLLSVAEKVSFALWQLLRTPLYFDDALTHWAGRSRALYGGVNWSLDPRSPVWLGYDEAARHYPLLTIVWRAETALCGGWDDLIARADGLLFFLATIATVWLAVLHFSQARWFAALAAFMVAAVPLQAWHAAAGYSDIGVEAFAVAALAALLRREWLLAGVLAAGTAWTKNDGLVVFLPPLLLGAMLLQLSTNVLWFLAGCGTLAPWLFVKFSLALGVAPNKDRFAWHPEALGEFYSKVLTGPTSSILWIGIAGALLYTGRPMIRDATGRALLGILLAALAALFFVYACTESHIWLANEGTIHRSMLQLSASAIVIAGYGLWRRLQPLSGPPGPAARDDSFSGT